MYLHDHVRRIEHARSTWILPPPLSSGRCAKARPIHRSARTTGARATAAPYAMRVRLSRTRGRFSAGRRIRRQKPPPGSAVGYYQRSTHAVGMAAMGLVTVKPCARRFSRRNAARVLSEAELQMGVDVTTDLAYLAGHASRWPTLALSIPWVHSSSARIRRRSRPGCSRIAPPRRSDRYSRQAKTSRPPRGRRTSPCSQCNPASHPAGAR